MSIEVKVPTLPESVADGTIVAWHKQPGEAVEQDETLVEIETDKVVLEVPAPETGVLENILHAEGETVTADTVIGTVAPGEAPAKPAVEKEAAVPEKNQSAQAPAKSLVPTEAALEAQAPVSEDHLSPSQRRRLGEGEDVGAILGVAATTPRTEKRVPMTRLRARVAERLLAAQQENAILTTFNEINMHAVMGVRKHHKERFLDEYGVRLGFMSFFVKAAAQALKEFPEVNASVDGKDILYHNYYDIGVAISSPRGLVVPVIRNADQLSFAEVEQQIIDYAMQAKEGKLAMEDMVGGTFTITNGGTFGSMMSTPIINPPQSAILGMHNIVERPIAQTGEVVIRPMMYAALSYDHRIIDGSSSVRFLVRIKDMIEDPSRLLLQV